jgi:predicted tellurium resistance membrane protein TerC
MNYVLVISAIFLGWTVLHMMASERERQVQELHARAALEAKLRADQKRAAQAPIVVS